MRTKKLRILSALLALAMLFALMPTAAFAEDGNNKCGVNLTWKLENSTLTISGTGAMDDYDARNNHLPPWYSRRNQIQEVVIGNGVTSIGNDSFNQCTNLKTIDLSNATSLEKIGSRAFLKRLFLEKVDLSKAANLKEIGEAAFASCSNVTQIEIPASVTNIEEYAFWGCEQLKSVTFAPGSKLETVDSGAFSGCDNMKIYYSDSNVETALSGKVGSETMVKRVKVTFDPNGGSEVDSQTVESGKNVTEPTPKPTRAGWNFAGWYTKDEDNEYKPFDFNTTITEDITLYARWTASGTCGDNLTWILDSDGTMTISGSGAMADYGKADNSSVYKYPPWDDHRDKITKLVVENGVITIGNNAFSDCTALKDVDLSKASSLETIGNHAFSSCTALKSVDLSEASSLTTIKTSFPGCTGLENVVLNEGLVEIGGSAFNTCTSLGSIHIPSTVTAIGGYCFERCTSLSKVTFEAGSQLTTIAEATFAGCKILETITIPKKVKKIQDSAFNGCGGLKSVTFEPGSELETIGLEAFQDTAISEISIPASVKTIGRYAFNECLNLTKVIFESPSKLDTVDENAFKGCSATIYYSDETAKNALISGKVDADRIKPLTPTVTFISNGGSDVKPATVKNENTISAPDAPTRKGYKFMGWHEKISENEYKPFDFSTPIKDNITLYAQWEEVPVDTYVVTVENGVAWVEADAETEAVAVGESICVPEGVTVHVKADETALEGMTFERWEVRKGEVKLENDRAAKTSFTMPAGEVQLEAMYQAADVHDSGWDAATVVTGAVIGTGTAILAYHIGMEVYAEQVLGKGVAVPRTRGEVALLAWQLAGSPAVNGKGEPLSEAAQAERWAVESGLMEPDAEGNFNGTKKMSKWKALRVLDAAKKQG